MDGDAVEDGRGDIVGGSGPPPSMAKSPSCHEGAEGAHLTLIFVAVITAWGDVGEIGFMHAAHPILRAPGLTHVGKQMGHGGAGLVFIIHPGHRMASVRGDKSGVRLW